MFIIFVNNSVITFANDVASDLIKSHHQIIITLIYLNRFITFGNITRTSVGVSKMNAVSRAQLLFQMITVLKNIYIARASVKKHGQQMSGPDSSNG